MDRALRILEALGEDPDGYILSDLAVRTGLAPSTLHRLVTALETRSFAQCDRQNNTWHVGPQLFAIGSTFARRRNLVAAAMPILRELRDASGERSCLAIRDGGSMTVLARVDGRALVHAPCPVGSRVPVFSSALGKAMLSTYDDDDVSDAIRRYGMKPLTARSITRASLLREDLRATRDRGYATDCGEYLDDLHGVAAPVHDADGQALAAVAICGPNSRVIGERMHLLGRAVRDAARRLGNSLGG